MGEVVKARPFAFRLTILSLFYYSRLISRNFASQIGQGNDNKFGINFGVLMALDCLCQSEKIFVPAHEEDKAMNAHATQIQIQSLSLDRADFVKMIRRTIHIDAFAFWEADAFRRALGDVDVAPIIEAARSAPVDQQDPRQLRRRYFGGGIIYPWTDPATWTIVPPFYDRETCQNYTNYFQTLEINEDAGGNVRRFAPIPQRVWEMPALWRIVEILLDATPADLVQKNRPVSFHIHIITLLSDGTRSGLSLPYYLHMDFEPATFVVLLERSRNAGGGVSHVAKPSTRGMNIQDVKPEDVLAERTLCDSLEGFGFWDSRVTHDLTPIRSIDGKPALRSALLIDFGNVNL